MYLPKPIDTKDVKVPVQLHELADEIAENVHEVWAKGRYEQGWRYGPVRDDTNRLTPCMVPYDELTAEEKAYDYNTAFETIKLVLKLGYKISKVESQCDNAIGDMDGDEAVNLDLFRQFDF